MYKTYGELSTTCHHFEYRPLEIARFQRAVTSFILCLILFKLSLVVLNNEYFTIKVNLICGFWFPLTTQIYNSRDKFQINVITIRIC